MDTLKKITPQKLGTCYHHCIYQKTAGILVTLALRLFNDYEMAVFWQTVKKLSLR